MTSQGSPRGRFERAIRGGHVWHADVAVRELGGHLSLSDALSLVMLYVRADDPRALRAVYRWVRRARDEHALSAAEGDLLTAALLGLGTRFGDAAVETLQTACRRLGLSRPTVPGPVPRSHLGRSSMESL